MKLVKSSFHLLQKSHWLLLALFFAIFIFYLTIVAQTSVKAFPIGSNEASMCLDYEPNIVDLDSYLNSSSPPKFIFSPFSYSNQSTLLPGLYTSAKMRPQKFYYSGKTKYPIFFNSRASGYPYFFIKEVSKFFTPSFALKLNLFFTSILTWVLVSFALYRRSGTHAVLFTALLLGTSTSFIFFGSAFPDTQWAIMLTALLLYFVQIGKNWTRFFTGVILVLILITKLSFLGYLLIVLYFFKKEFHSGLKPIIFGALTVLIPIFFLQNYNSFSSEVFHSRPYTKNLTAYFSGFLSQFIHFISPSTPLQNLFDQNGTMSLSFFSTLTQLPYSHCFYLLIFLYLCFMSFKTNYKNIFPFFFIFIFLCSYNVFFSKGMDGDFYHYQNLTEIIFLILFAGFIKSALKKSNEKKLFYTFIVLFVLGRLHTTLDWSVYFKERYVLGSEISIYEQIAKKLEERKIFSPITFYYENVGQLEFFSKGRITPTHFVWKYTQNKDHLSPKTIISSFSGGYFLLPIRTPELNALPHDFQNMTVANFLNEAKALHRIAELKDEFIFSKQNQHYALIYLSTQK